MPEENRIFAKSRHQPTLTVQAGATLCKCVVYEKVEFFIFQSKTMRTWSSDRKWFGLQRVQRRLTRTTSLTDVALHHGLVPSQKFLLFCSFLVEGGLCHRICHRFLYGNRFVHQSDQWSRGDTPSTMRRQDSSFCHMMDLRHLKNSELEKSS